MKSPFTMKANHWWDYLNPFWWRRKRVFEAVMAHAWQKYRLEEKFNQAISDSLLYGTGKFEVDWLAEDKKHEE